MSPDHPTGPRFVVRQGACRVAGKGQEKGNVQVIDGGRGAHVTECGGIPTATAATLWIAATTRSAS